MTQNKKICFFGIYDSNYSRNKILMKGFRENGFDVLECRVDPRVYGRIEKYAKLYREYQKIKHEKIDYLLVAFPGPTVVWLARLLFGKGIIFDSYLSQYNTNVFDRKSHAQYGISGMKDFFLDMTGCLLSKTVLLDTNEHIRYFMKTYGIPERKFLRVFIGADDATMFPVEKKSEEKPEKKTEDNEFIVHYHGGFIPLQGIEHILRAAKVLSHDASIKFRFFGTGQERARMGALAKELGLSNVTFYDPAPHPVLREKMAQAHVCLGLFGTAERIDFSIPNKLFEAIACRRAVITAHTKASLELFTDRKDVLFCERGNGEDLAEKILLLKIDPKLREAIAENSYRLFKERLTPKIIVKELIEAIS